jgi:Acetyl-CoA dehydrogenase C-terminal like/Acyl-CoA dehydrogenase, C-terminal domain
VYVGQQLDITKFSTDPEAVKKANDRVALLTPIAKAYLTDTAFQATLDAQMVFGGHGYIREWGMEQCVRDLRIAQIYEGTNGVQSQDLIGRKLIKNNGAFLEEYIAEIRDFANNMDTHLNFIKDATLDAATDIEAVSRFIIEQASEKPDFSNSVAVDFLHAVGLLSFSYMFARIAAAAKDKSGEFYQNKLTLAHYFVQRILPELSMRIAKINAGSDLVMEFSEEFFTSQS